LGNSRSIDIDTGFSSQALGRILTEELKLPVNSRFRVAYSGGMDSHVLLYALARLRAVQDFVLCAVHVHHGLQPAADEWARHCEQICVDLDIPCVVERIHVADLREQGLEAAARRGRYACLARHLEPGEILLTAHHQDDQAETMLLQLLRGAGIQGLAGMAPLMTFAAGQLARPLLSFPRHVLERYARAEGLCWVDDPSNRDLRHGRNLVRHKIFPALQARWPMAVRQLAHTARHATEAAAMLEEVARADLDHCQVDEGLRISLLAQLPAPRRRNVLRYWIRQGDFQTPSAALLERVLALTEHLPRTRHAMIRWSGAELRCYRDLLVLRLPGSVPEPAGEVAWDGKSPLLLPATGQRLRLAPVQGAGLARARLEGAALQVRFRQGGERCQLPGRPHHHKLKKLLQAAGVPPWERARLPLLYVNDALAAVGDRWVCEPYAAKPGEPGWTVILETPASESTGGE
jgi:tRNA(Ile)-lysidine synthase